MSALKVMSLAGTDEKYVILQARIKGSNIKLQGLGCKINREYGFTEEVSCSELPLLKEFIEKNS